MKMLSDNAVTKADLNSMDARQNEQLAELKVLVRDLKLALIGAFVFNLAVTVILFTTF